MNSGKPTCLSKELVNMKKLRKIESAPEIINNILIERDVVPPPLIKALSFAKMKHNLRIVTGIPLNELES